ncbi:MULTISPECIES: CopD family protein [unclassified Legionella]|uniref:CopD family protein n=1 Tax=unclassified Legionella TaxID=2622702 RepID=UPI001054F8E3|nr:MULTISPECIES: CopD family protein [unclassified Legionella]MDI9817588.1 CopD family protein [Legionella sp. PL877]
MPWTLILHIAALLCWCGSLLYVPTLIAGIASQTKDEINEQIAISRLIFTLILTPAALIAIVSGTIIFLQMNTLTLWLLAKLTLVSGLVVCHVFNGLLIIKAKKIPPQFLKLLCYGINLMTVSLIVLIVSLVLGKPF